MSCRRHGIHTAKILDIALSRCRRSSAPVAYYRPILIGAARTPWHLRYGWIRGFNTTARQFEGVQAVWESTVTPPSAEPPGLVKGEDAFETSSIDSLTACPGCGAYAQTIEADVAGFYTLKRAAVQKYIQVTNGANSSLSAEEAVYAEAAKNAGADLQKQLKAGQDSQPEDIQHPLCDRCHDLLHHHKGTSIMHPSLESLSETLAESAYKYNHVYHVLDAADFPMSVVPQVRRMLSVAPQRSRNRRAQQFIHGKQNEMSFIITRSDLLAPKKEQVDGLMPYFVETLRDALGQSTRHVRLGNVRCVSAKRGWWTKTVKDDIWRRGGGGWLVGKVNVGKSNLYETVFPKGRNQNINMNKVRAQARNVAPIDTSTQPRNTARRSPVHVDESDLLPPARVETAFPTMPTVSSLPGTTASPIRIPFGNGKGELIDLPGLKRSDINTFVREEEQESIIMKKRPIPEQFSIPPGSSLLLGGLIRITPVDQTVNILAYPFVPLQPHLTKTEKALEAQEGKRSPIPFVTKDGVSNKLKSAGIFELDTDVTKQRAGPLVANDAVGLKPVNLSFRVLATDVLIESIGWVELVAQVRRKDLTGGGNNAAESTYPRVEVFSPEGRFVGSRKSMSAWALGGAKKSSLARKRVQPINRRLKARRAASKGG